MIKYTTDGCEETRAMNNTINLTTYKWTGEIQKVDSLLDDKTTKPFCSCEICGMFILDSNEAHEHVVYRNRKNNLSYICEKCFLVKKKLSMQPKLFAKKSQIVLPSKIFQKYVDSCHHDQNTSFTSSNKSYKTAESQTAIETDELLVDESGELGEMASTGTHLNSSHLKPEDKTVQADAQDGICDMFPGNLRPRRPKFNHQCYVNKFCSSDNLKEKSNKKQSELLKTKRGNLGNRIVNNKTFINNKLQRSKETPKTNRRLKCRQGLHHEKENKEFEMAKKFILSKIGSANPTKENESTGEKSSADKQIDESDLSMDSDSDTLDLEISNENSFRDKIDRIIKMESNRLLFSKQTNDNSSFNFECHNNVRTEAVKTNNLQIFKTSVKDNPPDNNNNIEDTVELTIHHCPNKHSNKSQYVGIKTQCPYKSVLNIIGTDSKPTSCSLENCTLIKCGKTKNNLTENNLDSETKELIRKHHIRTLKYQKKNDDDEHLEDISHVDDNFGESDYKRYSPVLWHKTNTEATPDAGDRFRNDAAVLNRYESDSSVQSEEGYDKSIFDSSKLSISQSENAKTKMSRSKFNDNVIDIPNTKLDDIKLSFKDNMSEKRDTDNVKMVARVVSKDKFFAEKQKYENEAKDYANEMRPTIVARVVSRDTFMKEQGLNEDNNIGHYIVKPNKKMASII